MTASLYSSRPIITPFLLPLLLYILSSTKTVPESSTSSTQHEYPLSPTEKHLLSTVITTRLHVIANISTTPSYTNRPYLSEASIKAQSQIAEWMRQSGLRTHIDQAGNIIGDLLCLSQSTTPRSKIILGSHHDTVPQAGRFDGLYGVISSISITQILSSKICNLPFDIRVVAFDDEEGNNNFGTTNMGSRAYTGNVNWEDINKQSFTKAYRSVHRDENPIQKINEARGEVPLAYLELHLEQGPVLEQRNKAVGIVDAIAGQTRMKITLKGQAGHAGTVPMTIRRDALTTAAEGTLAVEHAPVGVVGTVGKLVLEPGVVNVVPGRVSLSVDIRSSSDLKRKKFVSDTIRRFSAAGRKRNVDVEVEVIHDVPAVRMSDWLIEAMKNVKNIDGGIVTSGAGHDTQIMASVTDVGMLFVRCRDGISHRPDEHVTDDDVFRGAKALLSTVMAMAERVKSCHNDSVRNE